MTFTYASDLSTDLSKVRHLLQDIDSTRPLLQDAGINFALANNGSDIFSAAADSAETIAANLGRKLSRSALDITDDPQAVAQFYLDLARSLRTKRNTLLTIFAGGRSVSDKRSLSTEDDKTQPAFGIGQDDYTSNQDFATGRYSEND
jgi:hypothetical protein